jgi:2-haloacid dehalogenase
MATKALVFDAYGTLYDVHSVYAKTEALCPGKGDLITQIWRLKQLEYTWLQTSLQDYRDFTFLTQAALEFALRAAGVEPSETSPSRYSKNISILIPTPTPGMRSAH